MLLIYTILLTFIVISAALAWYFLRYDRGEREPIGALWLALGFGFVGGIVAAIVEHKFISPKDISSSATLTTIFTASMLIGIIEEACKFIPLSIFLYPKRYFNEHSDGIIYFAIAGLGFGLPENILYTVQFGSSAGFKRVLLTPFFHAAITGMVGFFLIKAKLAKRSLLPVWLVMLLAMLVHGLYDFGLATGLVTYTIMSITITLVMTLVLFLLYTRATDLDQRLGTSAVGNNKYCRSCGQPNPEHHLYCTHCGKRA